jgi:hypothetical protein
MTKKAIEAQLDEIMRKHILEFLSFGDSQEWFNVKFRNAMIEYAEIKSKQQSIGFAEWIKENYTIVVRFKTPKSEGIRQWHNRGKGEVFTSEQLYKKYLESLK